MNLLKKIGGWFSAHRPTKRRLIQLYAALLTNANLKGFRNGNIYKGDLKQLCVPGLNCYSCPGAAAACPLGALQNALSASGARIPYYIFGILLLYALLFGRWICGFLCPFGLIQDLLHKIKTPKLKKSRVTRVLSYFKYVILAVFVVILPLIYAADALNVALPAFCKYICPSGTLLGAVGLLSNEANEGLMESLGPLFTWKFCLLVIFLVGAIFLYRFFCRFFCPLGALYGLFNRISLLGMKVDKKSCVDCGLCVGKCEMDIRKVGDHECISCGSCISVCPTGAISRKGPKILLPPNETGGRTAGARIEQSDELFPGTKPLPKKTKIARVTVAILLLALLGGALYYYNFVDGKEETEVPEAITTEPFEGTTDKQGETAEPAPSLGKNVGDLCYSYELRVNGGNNTVSVENTRGKITMVNFWYVGCGGCEKELEFEFPLLEAEYGDDLTILAIHADMNTTDEEVQAWVDSHMPEDCSIIFCHDGSDDEYYNMLGGRGAYPMTLILDEDGVIVEVFYKALTYESAKAAIDAALAD